MVEKPKGSCPKTVAGSNSGYIRGNVGEEKQINKDLSISLTRREGQPKQILEYGPSFHILFFITPFPLWGITIKFFFIKET